MSIRYTGSHVVGPKGTACLAGLNIEYKKTRDIKLVRCLRGKKGLTITMLKKKKIRVLLF